MKTKVKINEFNKFRIVTRLSWLKDIKMKNKSYIVGSDAAMVLHDIKTYTDKIDIYVSLIWFIKIYIKEFLNTMVGYSYIPQGISIHCKLFTNSVFEYEKMYGFNVQTLESLITEKKNRNTTRDRTDITIIENHIKIKNNSKNILKELHSPNVFNSTLDYSLGPSFYPSIKLDTSKFGLYGIPEICKYHKYKIIHLLGKTRGNETLFRSVEKRLTEQGFICFAPVVYTMEEYLKNDKMLDDMCYQKLLMADACVIVTPDHIGESTTNRIKQCKELNKPVYTINENGELIEYES